jgi:hypothetical protein
MLIIYRHTKFHIPIYSGSSAVMMSSDVFVFEGSLKWGRTSERIERVEKFQKVSELYLQCRYFHD